MIMQKQNSILLFLLLNTLALTVFGQSTFIANLFDTTQSGTGTYYGGTTGGNCGYGTLIPSFVNSIRQVAIATTDYVGDNQSEGCGMCLQMQGTGTGSGANPVSETPFIAFVSDQCPSCGANGIDIALPGDGAWGITWIAVPCPVGSSTIQYQLQGSNPYYLKLQVIGSRIPITGVEFVIGGVNYPATRTQDNFWLNPSNAPTPFVFPLEVLLTAYNGATLKDTILTDDSFTSSVLLSGLGVQFPGTTPTIVPTNSAKTPPIPTPTPIPTPIHTPIPTPTPPTPIHTPIPTPTPVSTTGLTCGDTNCNINEYWVEFQTPTSFTGTAPSTASVLCSGTTNVPCTWYADGNKYQCKPSAACSDPIPIFQGKQCPFPTVQAVTSDQTASEGGLSLSVGAIVGIVVGCAVLVVSLIVIVIRVVKKRNPTEEFV